MNCEKRLLEYGNVKAYVENVWPRQCLRWGPGHPPELDREPCLQKDIQLLESLAWKPLTRPRSRVWAEAAKNTSPPKLIECNEEGTVCFLFVQGDLFIGGSKTELVVFECLRMYLYKQDKRMLKLKLQPLLVSEMMEIYDPSNT